MFRRLVAVALVVVLLVGVAEVFAPRFVADTIERELASQSEGGFEVAVDVSGPPLIVPAVTTGEVEWIVFDFERVAGRSIPFDVEITAREVVIDRSGMLRGDLRVQEVREIVADLRIDLDGVIPEQLRAVAEPVLEAGLDVLTDRFGDLLGLVGTDGALQISGLVLDVVGGLESCTSTAQGLVVRASCRLDNLPPMLLRAVQP